MPRLSGPLELRADASVYYVLGTSIAQGAGYRLPSEPGAIEAVQYPPLLPAIIAVHQLALGTDNPFIVGAWLKATWIVLHLLVVGAAFFLMRRWLPPTWALAGTLLYALNFPSYFHFSLLSSELPFAAASFGFLLAQRPAGSGIRDVAAAALAMAAFFIRTVGIALFAAAIVDAVVRRRYRSAAIHCIAAAACLISWNGWIHKVESSPEYRQPAYAYQRADYMFYNVSYARNITYVDPYRPELGRTGPTGMVDRVHAAVLSLPVHVGEATTSQRGFWEMQGRGVERKFGFNPLPPSAVTFLLIVVAVACGLGCLLLVRQGQYVVPVYLAATLLILCVAAPWPTQQVRYLAPIAPLLILGLVVFLSTGRGRLLRARRCRPLRFLVDAALIAVFANSLATWVQVHTTFFSPNPWISDAQGRAHSYRQLFEHEGRIALDEAISWLQTHADRGAVVAAAMPQWVYLRTRLQAVMPPLETDPEYAQALLDSVPVRFLIRETPDIFATRYVDGVVDAHPERWKLVFTAAGGRARIYERQPKSE